MPQPAVAGMPAPPQVSLPQPPAAVVAAPVVSVGPAPIFPPAVPPPPRDAGPADTEPTQFIGDAKTLVLDEEGRQKARTAHAEELVAECEGELGKNPEPPRAGRLHYEMARAYEGVLDDLEKAREHYALARERLPEHAPTLRGSRRVAVALGRHAEALLLYDAESRLVPDAADKAMLLYEKGVLLEDRMGQRKEARRAYAAALELDESNPTILKAFERSSVMAAEWDDVERTMEREANAVSSDAHHRSALLAARARVIDARKAEPERAIQLYQTALELDPRAPGALIGVKGLLYAHERWRDLIAVLEEEATQAADAEARALARYRVGRLYLDRLGALDEAISALESAVTESPSDSMILGELARVYELGKRWGKLSQVLETIAANTPSSSERVALMHRVAQISEERLGDAERATDWYRRALDTDPSYVPALQALGKLYTRSEHWTALIAMHLGEAGATRDNARRASAHGRVAQILEERLGNVDQAIEHHSRALALVPGYAPAFKALGRLYAQGDRFRELAELYERAVDQAKDVESKITYLFKVGRIQEDALGAPLTALAAYRRILVLDPGHLGALHALQRAAERGQSWEELIAALDLEAERAKEPSDRAALLYRAAEVAEERLGDVEGAITRCKSVLAVDPAYAPVLSSLGRLYYGAGRWDELLATYQLELKVTEPGASSAALLYKMGELAEERIGRAEDAIRFYRDATVADPRHLTAIRALARLLADRQQWKDVVNLLELELAAVEDKPLRARSAFRIGEVYEHRVLDRAKALDAYERALAEEPGFRPALDGRGRLLERAKEYRVLVDSIDVEAQVSRDPATTVALRLRAAEVFRDQLAMPERAAEAYEAVLALDPDHLGALLALEPLYAELGRSAELATCLEAQARILQNGFARVAVLRELARLSELKMDGAATEVVEKYLAISRVAPSDASALRALARVALAQKNWALLAQIDAKLGALSQDSHDAAAYQTSLAEELELSNDPSALDTYRSALARDPESIAAARGFARLAARMGTPALLGDAAQHAARVLRDPEHAASLLVRSARVRLERERDPAAASNDLTTALEFCPDHEESARKLSEILLPTETSRLADILAHAAGRAKDKGRRAALWVAVAGLHADYRGDVGAGLSALGRALAERPVYVPALMKEAELYARDKRSAEAVERLSRVVAAAPEPPVLLAAHLALGARLRELDEPARAITNLQAALEIDPHHKAALATLLDLQMEQNDLTAATETATRLVAVCPEGRERADALTRLARLERSRGSSREAMDAYRQAVASTGVDGPALEEMRSLIAELKKRGETPPWDVYADGLRRFLERGAKENDQRLVPVFLELSRVFADELAQVDRAVEALRIGTSRFSKDAPLRTELAIQLRRLGRHAEAAEELRRLVDLEPLRLGVWQSLSESLNALGRADLGGVANDILVALGGGTDMERIAAQSRVVHPVALEPGAVDAESIRLLDAAVPEDAATTRLLACAAPGLERVYPPSFEAYGISKGDRISSRSGHPTRLLVDRLARVLNTGDVDLYIHHAHSGSIEVEFGDPLAIMVPAHIVALPESQQAFLLGRVLVDVVRGVYAVDKLAPSAIGEILVAAMRTVDPAFGAGQARGGEYLENLTKNLYRGLPRRARRPLEEAAAAYGPSPKPRLDDWLARVRKTSTRAALLLSGDAAGAVTVLRRTEGDLAGLEGVALERGMATLADALRFAVSEVAATVRRRIGG
ncbi:MAG TPA: tetratricopeptide repeat protein [Polyangiaceae bacterium]|jgi:tetratricopeptide (TPR) repeat protein|nr:tetratricopeptide repeat protein [Polyangiaceae bacterium]